MYTGHVLHNGQEAISTRSHDELHCAIRLSLKLVQRTSRRVLGSLSESSEYPRTPFFSLAGDVKHWPRHYRLTRRFKAVTLGAAACRFTNRATSAGTDADRNCMFRRKTPDTTRHPLHTAQPTRDPRRSTSPRAEKWYESASLLLTLFRLVPKVQRFVSAQKS